MDKIFYVYVLISEKDPMLDRQKTPSHGAGNNFYVGYTDDIKRRLTAHNNGKVSATKDRLPMKMIYWEGCLNAEDAIKREKYLKTTWGKKYLKERLKQYLADCREDSWV